MNNCKEDPRNVAVNSLDQYREVLSQQTTDVVHINLNKCMTLIFSSGGFLNSSKRNTDNHTTWLRLLDICACELYKRRAHHVN
jgi:hypothetical protein